MTDQDKAKRLLATATRVMTPLECELCRLVESGLPGGTTFIILCERLEIYLR